MLGHSVCICIHLVVGLVLFLCPCFLEQELAVVVVLHRKGYLFFHTPVQERAILRAFWGLERKQPELDSTQWFFLCLFRSTKKVISLFPKLLDFPPPSEGARTFPVGTCPLPTRNIFRIRQEFFPNLLMPTQLLYRVGLRATQL